MTTIFLDRIDSAPLQNEDFSFEFFSWTTTFIDIINEDIREIEDQLNGKGLATFITRKTTAEITALIAMNAIPVLEVGSLWFDTTINKLKVLVTSAIPGVSNGVTETVTSV